MAFTEFLDILLDLRSSLVLGVLVVIFCAHYIRKTKTAPFPPGPRGLPFVGNVLDVPTTHHWLKFAELGNVWGNISSLTVFGQTMVIVNSVEVAEDLMDARGADCSDRPVMQMAGELSGFNNSLPLCHDGERTRRERKLFHQLFGTPRVVKQFIPLISAETHILLRRLLANPGALTEEIERTTGAITLRIAYGYHLRDGPGPDPFLQMFQTTANNFMVSTTPGAFLVDLIPALRYWPEWLPGGGFQTTAKAWSQQMNDTVDTGLQYVKNQMATGAAETSFLSTLLKEKNPDDHMLKWAAISLKVGSSAPTAAQLEGFFLAMSLYPEVQAAAQAEIDRVVGNGRLPDFSDRAQLPYVSALCKEVLRWHVAAPIGIPHRAREDYLYYRGEDAEPLLIPKNSLIMPNLWKMLHDPKRYSDPMAFKPSRFIASKGKEAEQDPARICFGYGRRMCPGRLMGEASIFLACSAVLSVFNISKARDNFGIPVEPELGQTSTTVSRVLPFKCDVAPRNAQALALIQSS
ncbi:cytochrome P450 [Mycena leptocephala]|nr:cytochrome P450 [Mycena leptocephala]